MLKTKIEKILEELRGRLHNNELRFTAGAESIYSFNLNVDNYKAQASSSLTSLIIKWLEGKKMKVDYKPKEDNFLQNINFERAIGRNQLITELIGELRCGK
jgi:hypothetical protein